MSTTKEKPCEKAKEKPQQTKKDCKHGITFEFTFPFEDLDYSSVDTEKESSEKVILKLWKYIRALEEDLRVTKELKDGLDDAFENQNRLIKLQDAHVKELTILATRNFILAELFKEHSEWLYKHIGPITRRRYNKEFTDYNTCAKLGVRKAQAEKEGNDVESKAITDLLNTMLEEEDK